MNGFILLLKRGLVLYKKRIDKEIFDNYDIKDMFKDMLLIIMGTFRVTSMLNFISKKRVI